jgi:hypothetical protein
VPRLKTMETTEAVLFKNHFGTVTDKRITLKYKSGAEDIPIGHITSVSLKRKRNYFMAVGSFVISFAMLFFALTNHRNAGGIEMFVVFLLVLVMAFVGIAHWMGNHNIVISTSGQDRKPLKVEMSKTREGREFVEAVKKAIFR